MGCSKMPAPDCRGGEPDTEGDEEVENPNCPDNLCHVLAV